MSLLKTDYQIYLPESNETNYKQHYSNIYYVYKIYPVLSTKSTLKNIYYNNLSVKLQGYLLKLDFSTHNSINSRTRTKLAKWLNGF